MIVFSTDEREVVVQTEEFCFAAKLENGIKRRVFCEEDLPHLLVMETKNAITNTRLNSLEQCNSVKNAWLLTHHLEDGIEAGCFPIFYGDE